MNLPSPSALQTLPCRNAAPVLAVLLALSGFIGAKAADEPRRNPPPGPELRDFPPGPPGDFNGPPPGPDGRTVFRGPGGPGGFGGVREEQKLVKQFDKDGDKRLNNAERKAAREFLTKEKAEGRGQRRFGPRGRSENQEPPKPGPKVSPSDVKNFPNTPLYDTATLRTLFLEFENADWEKEMSDFHDTDVEVPARLLVDGKTYSDVGVHFRGMSSYMAVGEGWKRSLNLSLDFAHKDQELGGYRTLNLLNSHEDPTFMRPVLYLQIAQEFGLPAPKANFVRVVINGESWGIYVSQQQFNKDFTRDHFKSTKGTRWKVPGSPGGRGGLSYLGDDVSAYKSIYEIKSKDDPKAWADLIKFFKVLNETPADKLEEALKPVLDVEGALKFLALENALINNDGYWIRRSDYAIYEDEKGRFHILPHDVNETFSMPGGPGFGGGPRVTRIDRRPGDTNAPTPDGQPRFQDRLVRIEAGDTNAPAMRRGPDFGNMPRINGVELDPLLAAGDTNKPLAAKLLAVPAFRAKYLGYVREIAERWLDWKKLGPMAEKHYALIGAEVKADTRKLESYEAFEKGLSGEMEEAGQRGPRRSISLKKFAEQRRKYLLEWKETSDKKK